MTGKVEEDGEDGAVGGGEGKSSKEGVGGGEGVAGSACVIRVNQRRGKLKNTRHTLLRSESVMVSAD